MTRHIALASLVFCAIGCNQVAAITKKQGDAVTAVVQATCDRYATCGDIGSGKTYSNRTDCENRARDFWNGQWPVSDCDNKINGDNLTVCTDRISSTDCNNFIDQLNTVFDQCNKSDVCSG